MHDNHIITGIFQKTKLLQIISFTQGKTIEEAIHNIKEFLELILEIKHPKINIVLQDKLVDAI